MITYNKRHEHTEDRTDQRADHYGHMLHVQGGSAKMKIPLLHIPFERAIIERYRWGKSSGASPSTRSHWPTFEQQTRRGAAIPLFLVFLGVS